ncbi:YczE/YyaS/YitT family protein [Pontibacter roseus]|uniref:YczE/YyaS/YitT family protein n=1 Tax=Pontibacter roseus TaxID=336989 RepID=UPI0003697913|nr:YitT family protein [Pontibacter roseus]
MREKVVSYSFFFLGLLLFGFANALAVKVQYLGLHPWEVLNVALFQKLGFTIGTWSAIVGLFFVAVSWFVNRKYINIGTFLNALLVGPFMDMFLWLDIPPSATNTPFDYINLACSVIIAGIAGGMYVAGGVGAGPRDGFMLAVSERVKLSVSRTRILVECVILAIGYVLGGPIFIATFFYTFIMSPIFQVTLRFFQRLRMQLIEQRVEV